LSREADSARTRLGVKCIAEVETGFRWRSLWAARPATSKEAPAKVIAPFLAVVYLHASLRLCLLFVTLLHALGKPTQGTAELGNIAARQGLDSTAQQNMRSLLLFRFPHLRGLLCRGRRLSLVSFDLGICFGRFRRHDIVAASVLMVG